MKRITGKARSEAVSKVELGALGSSNYRDWAKAVIEKYLAINLIADGMIWAQIVKHYEAEAAQARDERDQARRDAEQLRAELARNGR